MKLTNKELDAAARAAWMYEKNHACRWHDSQQAP